MKRKTLRLAIAVCMVLVASGVMKAQEKHMGLALKGSTMGYGGDAVIQFNKRMTARLGYDNLNLNIPFDFEESDISYSANANVKTGALSALYDYYLARNIFVTTGVALNNFDFNTKGTPDKAMTYGDITIPKEKIGTFEYDVRPSLRVSPYLGVGFGRTISPDKLVAFCVELGAFYQGSPDVSIKTDGLLSPTSNPERGQEALYESQLSQYYLYPYLKFSLSFNLLSL
ncbi:MAG TPA: hypothetical protein VKA27_06240 [Sunxiuqinia sp.]|nr:hypothetical protein [Sunxiuqinia sp.]